MQNIADTLAKSVARGMAFVFRFESQESTLRISGYSPNRILSDVPAVEPIQRTPLRVLLVDDQMLLLKAVSGMLKRSGHMVQAAMGGQTAIRLLEELLQNGALREIMMTDLVMPEMDGRAVARSARALRTDFPVVLLTGWRRGTDLVSFLPAPIDTIVQKAGDRRGPALGSRASRKPEKNAPVTHPL